MHCAPPIERQVARTLCDALRGDKLANAAERLREPLADAPLTLAQQGPAEFGGIIVSGAVGPYLAARFALNLQNRRALHERSSADLAELRRMFDEVMPALEAVQREGAYFLDHPRAGDRRLQDALIAVDIAAQKLTTRLGGDSPVVRALNRAKTAMWVARDRAKEPGYDARSEFDGPIGDFAAHRRVFLAEAHKLIGASSVRTVPPSVPPSDSESAD